MEKKKSNSRKKKSQLDLATKRMDTALLKAEAKGKDIFDDSVYSCVVDFFMEGFREHNRRNPRDESKLEKCTTGIFAETEAGKKISKYDPIRMIIED